MGFEDGIASVVYDAVTCLDTRFSGEDASTELDHLGSAYESAALNHRWHYTVRLSCPFWPGVDRTQNVPAPFVGKDIPTLVVASDADPTTPYAAGRAVFEQLDRGHLLTVHGGSHVMFGRGNPCIDEAVTAFVSDGAWPEVESCDAEVISAYIPLIPTDVEDYEKADLLRLVDDELYYLPELVGWDWDEQMTVGCTNGGQITFTGTESGARSELEECGLTEDVVLSGTGTWDTCTEYPSSTCPSWATPAPTSMNSCGRTRHSPWNRPARRLTDGFAGSGPSESVVTDSASA